MQGHEHRQFGARWSARIARSPFSIRAFRWIYLGQVSAQLGRASQAVAASLLLKNATQSAAFVGTTLFAAGLVGLIALPLGGALADRCDRRFIVLAADACCAIAAALLSLTLLLQHELGHRAAIATAGCVVTCSMAAAFFAPAFGAIFPDLVDRSRLAQANATFRASAKTSEVVGASLGGVAYKYLGPAAGFALNALAYSASLICTWKIGADARHQPRAAHLPRPRLRDDICGGYLSVKSISGAQQFLLLALALNFVAAPVFGFMAFHVMGRLHGDEKSLGIVMASLSAGVVVGHLVAGLASGMFGKHAVPTFSVCMVTMCSGFFLFALAHDWRTAGASLFLAGVANGVWSIQFEIIFQRAMPREARGRIYALYALASRGVLPLGYLAGG